MRNPCNARSTLRWLAALAAAAGLAHAQDPDPAASPAWKRIHAEAFSGAPIAAGTGVVEIEVPARAQDGAVVPVAIRPAFAQSPERFIDRLWLIVDDNPSPVAAVFHLTPRSGRAEIETRIRVEQYTHVRAIARTNDGALHMASRFVKASGGCSAPPAGDATASGSSLGRVRLLVDEGAPPGRPALARLLISHPNASGLAMDQLTRTYAPAHFVRSIEVRQGETLVMKADLDITISQNPSFRFYVVPDEGGELQARVVDNRDLVFTTTLRPGGAGPAPPARPAAR